MNRLTDSGPRRLPRPFSMEGSAVADTLSHNHHTPYLRSSEEQANKVRKRLEEVFDNIGLVHDVIAISIEVCENDSGDFNSEMAHVLRCCGTNKLHSQMRALSDLIEKFGGSTKFSKQGSTDVLMEVSP